MAFRIAKDNFPTRLAAAEALTESLGALSPIKSKPQTGKIQNEIRPRVKHQESHAEAHPPEITRRSAREAVDPPAIDGP